MDAQRRQQAGETRHPPPLPTLPPIPHRQRPFTQVTRPAVWGSRCKPTLNAGALSTGQRGGADWRERSPHSDQRPLSSRIHTPPARKLRLPKSPATSSHTLPHLQKTPRSPRPAHTAGHDICDGLAICG